MMLFDFEASGLATAWEMADGGTASREACASGWCLHVRPVKGAKIATRRVPSDWTGQGELRLRARALRATRFEVGTPSGARGGRYWRRVDVAGDDWQEVRLPLAWWRRSSGPAPDWSSVRALSFCFRDDTPVWIDDVELVAGKPWSTPSSIAAVTGGGVSQGRIAANLKAPAHDGFTMEGIATSAWHPDHGIARPVYTHEFVHALLDRAGGLSNTGEWFQEGLATYYQLAFHPQADRDAALRRRLASALPLSRLCDGKHIETRYYADAYSIVGTLMHHPRWEGTIARVFDAAARTGSTSLVALGIDLDALDADRRAWAQDSYATR